GLPAVGQDYRAELLGRLLTQAADGAPVSMDNRWQGHVLDGGHQPRHEAEHVPGQVDLGVYHIPSSRFWRLGSFLSPASRAHFSCKRSPGSEAYSIGSGCWSPSFSRNLAMPATLGGGYWSKATAAIAAATKMSSCPRFTSQR